MSLPSLLRRLAGHQTPSKGTGSQLCGLWDTALSRHWALRTVQNLEVGDWVGAGGTPKAWYMQKYRALRLTFQHSPEFTKPNLCQ